MIDYTSGDILKDDADALVNTVNTVGVMGKGIALQFKRRFPDNFKAYLKACETGEVGPGRVFVWHTGRLDNPKHVINFPTKRHWKARSRLEDIEAGLRDLQRVIAELQISSIAVPPLGCGHGGLAWSVVRPLIEEHLGKLQGITVRVYQPSGTPAPATMPAHPVKPRLTPHRAAMVAAFARYLKPGFTLGRLEAQKLLYFLQVAGAPFDRLKFVQGLYGPYADGIRHVLNQVEGHLIIGFGDADTASRIRPVEAAVADADAMLDQVKYEAFRRAVDFVAELTDGFDDAYGLELLASVHWVATQGGRPVRNATEATALVHEWSHRKRARYDVRQVKAAWRRLETAGLVSTLTSDPPPQESPSTRTAAPVVGTDLIGSAL